MCAAVHRNNFNHGTVIPQHTYRDLWTLEGFAEETTCTAPHLIARVQVLQQMRPGIYIREYPGLSSRAGAMNTWQNNIFKGSNMTAFQVLKVTKEFHMFAKK